MASVFVKLGMMILTSPKARDVIKNAILLLCFILGLPLLVIGSAQSLTTQKQGIIEEVIAEVKEEKEIDNTLSMYLVLGIELSVYDATETTLTKPIIKAHVLDDYVKEVTILVEIEHSEPGANESAEVEHIEQEVSVFKTKAEILRDIQAKYELTNKQITDINMFIAMNNLVTIHAYSGDFQIPTESGTVTCGWGCYTNHTGTDIGGSEGTKILASAGGTVIHVNNGCIEGDTDCGGGFGNHVVLVHNIDGVDYVTIYGHMTETIAVENKAVLAGEVLGYMGNTGRSEGVHLHFEIIKDVSHYPSKAERQTLGINTEEIINYPESW